MTPPVLGLGTDLVECRRIADLQARLAARFLDRVFLPGETAYALSQAFPERHLAARFAAKEAVAKAFKTGIGADLGWRDVEVIRDPAGAPGIRLHGAARSLAARRNVARILLSLSHTSDYACATALLLAS
jgi:holo-[acyl-carrier protein] synthase